jgi:hypothetical protein
MRVFRARRVFLVFCTSPVALLLHLKEVEICSLKEECPMKRWMFLLVLGVWLAGSAQAVTISVHSYDTSFTADAVIDGSTHWVYIGAVKLNIDGEPLPERGVVCGFEASGRGWQLGCRTEVQHAHRSG